MDIGFIGAGKVGFSLGKFFSESGIHVIGYYSRHKESAQEAAAFTNTLYYENPGLLVRDCDALFLTVPDKDIASVYEEVKEYDISEKLICHCSGAMTAREAFADISSHGAYGYSIHPLFPISSKLESYRELSDAFFCIEGDSTYLEFWCQLLNGLGLHVQVISAQKKVRYHAACAMASNLMCGLISQSTSLLEDCGFSEEMAVQALAPLMRSNLEHVISEGCTGALTGPLERGDAGTVKKHLEELDPEKGNPEKSAPACPGKGNPEKSAPADPEKEHSEESGGRCKKSVAEAGDGQAASIYQDLNGADDGQALDIYLALSRSVLDIAKSKHPDRDYSQLERILGNGKKHSSNPSCYEG